MRKILYHGSLEIISTPMYGQGKIDANDKAAVEADLIATHQNFLLLYILS